MSGDPSIPDLLDEAALDVQTLFPDVIPADTTTPSVPILHPIGSYCFDLASLTTKEVATENGDANGNSGGSSSSSSGGSGGGSGSGSGSGSSSSSSRSANVSGSSSSSGSGSAKAEDSGRDDGKDSATEATSGAVGDSAAAASFQSFAEQNQRLQHENHRYSILVSQLTAEVSQLQFKVQSQQNTVHQLQSKMTAQRAEFDAKFEQFLACANQYDQSKSKEVEELKMQLLILGNKYKDLSMEYTKLSQMNTKWGRPPVKSWKWQDVFDWIASLNEPRLKKYDQALYDNLQRDGVTGQWLETMQEDDLYYLGVKNYTDRQVLMHHIKTLLHGLTHEPPPTLKSVSHSKATEVGSITPSSSVNQLTADYGYNMSPQSFLSGGAEVAHPDHSYYRQFSVEQLQQIRIRQKNIVYVVGLPVSLCNSKLLKSHKWFGKFGTISRVCFNTSPKCVKANSIPTFVTYTNEADALQAIRKMNLYCLSDGTRLKTNFGRTKFCPTFTVGQQCLNEKCKFLHQWAKVDDIITEQEISDFNAIRAGPPSRFSRR